jgi:hypothetical protein
LSFFRLQKRGKNYVFSKGKSGKLTKGREGKDDVRLVQLVVDAAHVDAACCTTKSRLFILICQPIYQLVLQTCKKEIRQHERPVLQMKLPSETEKPLFSFLRDAKGGKKTKEKIHQQERR